MQKLLRLWNFAKKPLLLILKFKTNRCVAVQHMQNIRLENLRQENYERRKNSYYTYTKFLKLKFAIFHFI